MIKTKWNLMISLFLLMPLAVTLSGCGNDIGGVAQPKSMKTFYLENGYIPLPIGDSRLGPGAIIEAKPEKGIRVLSHLEKCGVASNVLELNRGTSPGIEYNNEDTFDANAVLKIKGVEAGPKFNIVKSTKLSHEEHGGVNFDYIGFKIWLTENAGQFSKICEQELEKEHRFIVQEAFMVSKGKYTLLDNTNAAIKIEGLEFGPVRIEPGVDLDLGQNGELTFSSPIYTAIKNIQSVDGMFQTMGNGLGSKDESRDDYIREVISKKGFVN